MRRAFVTAATISLAALVLAAPATPAGAGEKELQRQITALRKQVTGLDSKVKALDKQVKTLQKTVKDQEQAFGFLVALSVCQTAITADALQGTWAVIDQVAQPTLQRTFFTPQAAVNDLGACTALQVARQQVAPPTLSAFVAYLSIFQSRLQLPG